MTNIEILLMLSQNLQAEGDDLVHEMDQRGQAHAKRVLELFDMLERARQILAGEKKRFDRYFPKPDQFLNTATPQMPGHRITNEASKGPEQGPMPKVAMQGPRS